MTAFMTSRSGNREQRKLEAERGKTERGILGRTLDGKRGGLSSLRAQDRSFVFFSPTSVMLLLAARTLGPGRDGDAVASPERSELLLLDGPTRASDSEFES
ncbi:hypothetical protein CSPX01_09643 [Colletotrichum filicis]|nr:hypothetical protein CSPX01_09643 [Colletotrichum filicis]